jgi:putative transposase
MDILYTAKQISLALSVADRTVRTRANKENWPFTQQTGRGGQIPHYKLADLPADVKTALVTQSQPEQQDTNVSRRAQNAATLLIKTATTDKQIIAQQKQVALKAFAGLSGIAQARAVEKVNLLTAAKEFQRSTGQPKVKAWSEFCDLYNSNHPSIDQSQFTHHNRISYISLSRWEKAYSTKGITALVGDYGKNKGTGIIDSTPELKEYCLALIQTYPHIKGERIADMLEAEFNGKYPIPAASTCRTWLSSWKTENQELYMSMFDPSAWQNKRMVAFGNMSISTIRINQLWEFDSTPADVMLVDGRYSIVGVIDVFTRRVKLVLKPTSNAEAIALLLRNTILDWGLPEVARTDNGADYLSHHITTVWNSLEIENDITNPYSGWEKPFIERFFRTFSHGIVELMQGYIGHNVTDRERITKRLTFAQQLIERREKGADKIALDVQLTAAQFEEKMNQWLEHHYHHTEHGGIKCTPFEKFTQHQQTIKRLEDPRMLDVLLSPVPGDGFRTITKSNGISVEGGSYIHAELGAYIGERVFCRWNPKDVGKIYVFHALHGHFICEAVNPEIAGQDITMAHAMEAKRIQRAQLTDQRKTFKKLAKQHDVSQAAQTYLDYKSGQNGGLNAFPKPSQNITTVATQSATTAMQNQSNGYTEQQISSFEQRRKELIEIEKTGNEIAATPVFVGGDNQKARYLTQLSVGTELPPVEKAWLHQYRRANTAAARMLDEILTAEKRKQK